jgi:hypothetical protein
MRRIVAGVVVVGAVVAIVLVFAIGRNPGAGPFA